MLIFTYSRHGAGPDALEGRQRLGERVVVAPAPLKGFGEINCGGFGADSDAGTGACARGGESVQVSDGALGDH